MQTDANRVVRLVRDFKIQIRVCEIRVADFYRRRRSLENSESVLNDQLIK